MASLGYVGEFVDQEEVAGNGQVRRMNGAGRKVSEEKLTKIIQAVTMAVLAALGESKKFCEEEENVKDEGLTLCMRALIVLIGCVCCYLIPVAAVLRIKRLKVERKRRREGMAEEAHSEVMEQRVEELAEMRQGAMNRRRICSRRMFLKEKRRMFLKRKRRRMLLKKKKRRMLRKKRRHKRKVKKRRARLKMSTPQVRPTRLKSQHPRRPRSRRISESQRGGIASRQIPNGSRANEERSEFGVKEGYASRQGHTSKKVKKQDKMI